MESNEGGRRLRHLREERGWTLDDLAEATDGEVSRNTIVNYEKGSTTAQSRNVLPLARAFGGQDGVWLLQGFGLEEDARMMADRMRNESGVSSDVIAVFEIALDELRRRAGRDAE